MTNQLLMANQQGNQRSQTSIREEPQPTLSLSSSVTSRASDQRSEPQPSRSYTEPRLSDNQQIRQPSECITTYDRVPNHDRVI